jgi:hypothetical protein
MMAARCDLPVGPQRDGAWYKALWVLIFTQTGAGFFTEK